MMFGVNVGKQLELLEKHGHVTIGGLLDAEQLEELKSGTGSGPMSKTEHEKILTGLVGQGPGFAQLATHPLVLQIVRRAISPACKLSSVLSCRTDADYVRKELEQTDWRVIHPYSAVEFPGIVDERISFTATWFLDDLDSDNSTWAWLRPPTTDGTHSPQLPQLSSREEIDTIVTAAKPLHASSGSVWLYVGPMWLSNNIGAASFWKDYDAQTRYKHFSGQKPQDGSFRALADTHPGNLRPRVRGLVRPGAAARCARGLRRKREGGASPVAFYVVSRWPRRWAGRGARRGRVRTSCPAHVRPCGVLCAYAD